MEIRKLMMLALAGCSLWATVATAQAQDQAESPPERVARLAVIEGDASLMPAGAETWGNASINRPLSTGDKLWVPDGSRVSLELGGAEIRLDGGSGFGILHLGDQTAQAQLTSGTLNLDVRHLYADQNYEIDTPTLAFVVDQRGEYRLDIAPDGHGTQVTVFRGTATVYGEDGVRREVSAGNSYRFADTSLAQVEVFPVPDPDGFDRWCFARDARYQRDADMTREYVSGEVIGYQDLADYGSWQNETDYGPVWFPSAVPVGWAPYSYGHWVWIAPWGWTWVDDAPWGFAPFHYGRWAYIGNRWGWVPGPLAVRPVYAPALVGFVGFSGSNWGIGIGIGGPVGWYPLMPGAVFVPWYRCGPQYFRNVNITNIRRVNRTTIVDIDRRYDRYRRGGPMPGERFGDHRFPPHALTVVPHDVFTGARQVGPHRLSRPEGPGMRELANGAPPAPGRGSLMARGQGQAPREPVFQREVLAHRTPPRAFMALPQRNGGYRLEHGARTTPEMGVRPQRIADNVRVIGQRPPRGVDMPVQPARSDRAGSTLAGPRASQAPRQAEMPSARYAPHRWQAGDAAERSGAGNMPRSSGTMAPQRGGTFSVIGSNHDAPAFRDTGPQPSHEARPREPGDGSGSRVIEAPHTGFDAPSRRAVTREPSYGQRAMVPDAQQFRPASQEQFQRERAPVNRPQIERAPQTYRQEPQFRSAPQPQFRPAPQPRIEQPRESRPASVPRPQREEDRHPPHDGGGHRGR